MLYQYLYVAFVDISSTQLNNTLHDYLDIKGSAGFKGGSIYIYIYESFSF